MATRVGQQQHRGSRPFMAGQSYSNETLLSEGKNSLAYMRLHAPAGRKYDAPLIVEVDEDADEAEAVAAAMTAERERMAAATAERARLICEKQDSDKRQTMSDLDIAKASGRERRRPLQSRLARYQMRLWAGSQLEGRPSSHRWFTSASHGSNRALE